MLDLVRLFKGIKGKITETFSYDICYGEKQIKADKAQNLVL